MPAQQRIRRDDGVKLEQTLSADGFGLARQKSPFCVREANSPAAKSILEQPVLSLKEFDDNQLMAMNPSCSDHQQKRQQRWRRAHAVILPPSLSFVILDRTIMHLAAVGLAVGLVVALSLKETAPIKDRMRLVKEPMVTH